MQQEQRQLVLGDVVAPQAAASRRIPGEMTWPERMANYRKLIGIPYLGHENGWTYGTWFMGNSYQKQNDYYGGYQGNFLKRVAALFPDRRRVLHLFSGKVGLDVLPGDTLDINPELEPTYCVNAETCEGVPLADYDFTLADPPYSASDAERYGTPMVNRNAVVKTLAAGLPHGAYVAWLDQVYPMYSKELLKPEAVIGIVGSTNHRFRVLTVFRRV
jgi:hypothetical protein